jgi:hypothetical protein
VVQSVSIIGMNPSISHHPASGSDGECSQRATVCHRCGLQLHPPQGVICYQPAAHTDPGPIVTAVAMYGESPQLRRLERVENGWRITGPGTPRPAENAQHLSVAWSAVGLCAWRVLHPVVAVHRDHTGGWVSGIAPGSVGEQSRLLAERWLAPHRLYRW